MFSKSSLIPPRYLFADQSFQSIKAAAISDLYLLNENTNGSPGSLDWCQGSAVGGRGGWYGLQLWSEEPSSLSEAVNRNCAEKHRFQHGMGLGSTSQGFLSDNSQPLQPKVRFRFFHIKILVCLQERETLCLPMVKGLALSFFCWEMTKIIYYHFSPRARIPFKTSENWCCRSYQLSLLTCSILKFVFSWMDVWSPLTFSNFQTSRHPRWKKLSPL